MAVVSSVIYAWRPAAPLRLALPMNTQRTPAASPEDGIWPASAGWPASAYLAVNYGEANGLLRNVKPTYRVAGKGAVASVVAGTNDVAWTFAPPVVEALAHREKIIVIAMVMRSKGQASLYVREENRNDWFTKRIAVKRGTITDSLLFAQLRQIGKLDAIRNGTIHIVQVVNPENLFLTLVNGEVEGASFPEAYGSLLKAQSDAGVRSGFVDITDRDAYPMSAFLIARPVTYERHKSTILGLLRLFAEYGKHVAANPEKALTEMYRLEAAGTPRPTARLEDLPWRPGDFLIVTDKKKVRAALAFEAQLRVDGGAMKAMPDLEPAVAALDDISRELKEP